jgi:hypothetical protein
MAYWVRCKSCGTESRNGSQRHGERLSDYRCVCGGALKRIGWQEMYRKQGGIPSAAQAAAAILRETEQPAIGWGDSGLLHAVAKRIGFDHEGPKTEQRVLSKLEQSYAGVLVKGYASYPGRGRARVRRYWLPETAPRPDGVD